MRRESHEPDFNGGYSSSLSDGGPPVNSRPLHGFDVGKANAEVPLGKPRLLVVSCNPDRRDIFANAGTLFERGVPVCLVHNKTLLAFGREPHAVTGGGTPEELDKRIAAELIGGGPALFLDNMNNVTLRSDTLASAITERPARVRLLGKSEMAALNASAMVILTGNGLTVSEDLARRFIAVDLDPRTEAPEARRFTTDIRVEVTKNRDRLLAAALTIWRWGRVAQSLPAGQPLGSFEQWCSWVRDPLLALGCKDPAERVAESKERDGRRQVIADLLNTWWKKHGNNPMPVADLADARLSTRNIGDANFSVVLGKARQDADRGIHLEPPNTAWTMGGATYALQKIEADETA